MCDHRLSMYRDGTDSGSLNFGRLRPLGILLGAGGIRGCAHVGVLSVLEELGLVGDVVVGSSIGSIFGAGYAAGWDAARLSRLTADAPLKAVAEFYLNRLRIDTKTYIGSLLSELGRDTLIEDLPRPFAAMALDCSVGRVVALTRGPLLQAVQASIALPGVARPVQIGSTSYLDGGLRGPIPASVARDLGAKSIVRVELLGAHPLTLAHRRLARSRLGEMVSRRAGRSARPAAIATAEQVGASVMPEVVITPQFYGLFCNSPLGIGFCANRGRSAAAKTLAKTLDDRLSGPLGSEPDPLTPAAAGTPGTATATSD